MSARDELNPEMGSFSFTFIVIKWAAQECEWQQSGEMSVAWMIEGWQYAMMRRDKPIALQHVLDLGLLVEPRTNSNGLRKVGVRVGYDVKMSHTVVPHALDRLLEHQGDLDPVEWFREYEEIHPFRDGNGRTGNILYNWLLGTLPEPVFPPNLWHDPRRDL